jgi:hypothetical protein
MVQVLSFVEISMQALKVDGISTTGVSPIALILFKYEVIMQNEVALRIQKLWIMVRSKTSLDR